MGGVPARLSKWRAETIYALGPVKEVDVTVGESGAFHVHIRCQACTETIDNVFHTAYPPHIIAKKLKQKGWQLGKHPKCPGCVKLRPHAVLHPVPVDTLVVAPEPTPIPEKALEELAGHFSGKKPESIRKRVLDRSPPVTNTDVFPVLTKEIAELVLSRKDINSLAETVPGLVEHIPSPADRAASHAKSKPKKEVTMKAADPVAMPASQDMKKAHRAIMQILEDEFDEDKGQYRKPGFNDEEVAKQTGASKDYVAEVRDSYFGPLSEPTELTPLRLALDAARKEIEELRVGMTADFMRIDREGKEKLTKILARVDGIEKTFDATAKRLGWVRK